MLASRPICKPPTARSTPSMPPGASEYSRNPMSGTRTDRPQLAAALEFAREGDVLVVARLDRLARSLRQLLTTVDTLGHGHGRGWLPVLFGCAHAEAPPRTARERRRCGGSAARSRWWCRCSRAATSDQCRVRSCECAREDAQTNHSSARAKHGGPHNAGAMVQFGTNGESR
jgi:hypothetical protein